MKKSKPTRLSIAQKVCRATPPIIAQKMRAVIYPEDMAIRDDYEELVRAMTGSTIKIKTGELHGYVFGVHGYYEWRNTAIAVALAGEGDTIIEIGANIGTETIGFSDIVGATGKVYAFEPFPFNLQALHEMMELATYPNVVTLPVALSDETRTASFVVPPEHQTGIGHVIAGNDEAINGTIKVDCSTLDSYGELIGPTKLITIDTEGEELRVLRGGRSFITHHKPFIILEASSDHLERAGTTIGNLETEVRELGYIPFTINKIGLSKIKSGRLKSTRNWLCVPKHKEELVNWIQSILFRSAIMPCLRGLNPLNLV
jgi:FkbM family methyltransferase